MQPEFELCCKIISSKEEAQMIFFLVLHVFIFSITKKYNLTWCIIEFYIASYEIFSTNKQPQSILDVELCLPVKRKDGNRSVSMIDI
jgi:hypothetical protein